MLVTREVRGQVAWLRLNRPGAKNALCRPLVAELGAHIKELSREGKLRAVVVAGVGDHFCAGADLKERQDMTIEETRAFVGLLNETLDALEALPQVTVAAIRGVALGGGLELALACDLRIAAVGAMLGLPEVRVGILPGAGGTVRLPRLIGGGRAREMILLGRRMTADQAFAQGLVNQVTSDLESSIAALGTELVACAPLGVREAKRALREVCSEREAYEIVLRSEDRFEGLRAFAEKRPPVFRGC